MSMMTVIVIVILATGALSASTLASSKPAVHQPAAVVSTTLASHHQSVAVSATAPSVRSASFFGFKRSVTPSSVIACDIRNHPQETVEFFVDADYVGAEYVTLNPDVKTLVPYWNDQFSSVKIGNNASVVAYVDINYGGGSKSFPRGQNNDDFGSFNDAASSFIVTCYSGPE